MDLKSLSEKDRKSYNLVITHVMQSWEWGEARISLGTPLERYGLSRNGKLVKAFQITFHKIPFVNQSVGYLPKGPFPDKDLADALIKIAKDKNCAFIKIEPNIEMDNRQWAMDKKRNQNSQFSIVNSQFIKSPKPLFTKYNFVLSLDKTEGELFKNLHSKTRYNVRLAQKRGVVVEERMDDKAFDMYLKLYFDTTKRQNYHGHNTSYHKQIWDTLKKAGMARLLIGFYKNKPLTAWMLLNFKDTLFYPYGGSSTEYKEVMSNNLVAWEAIRLGKKLNLKQFDMWGALGPSADSKDPWYGFHRFKQGYGGELVEYIGTYDLVLNWPLYWLFTFVDKLTPVKVFLLKLLSR
ncbi:peptidoglycan bridge formation glycyltransferase FemA/FemB family protein [Candidatus Daviesbacteria bacterium]|nr:peptidoglycan bridge formation glycyltransferase FemA/FemB family protein [Candidatus Daviesbacteria bacterium]